MTNIRQLLQTSFFVTIVTQKPTLACFSSSSCCFLRSRARACLRRRSMVGRTRSSAKLSLNSQNSDHCGNSTRNTTSWWGNKLYISYNTRNTTSWWCNKLYISYNTRNTTSWWGNKLYISYNTQNTTSWWGNKLYISYNTRNTTS